MSTFSNNVTFKVKQVASGGYVLGASEWAQVTYKRVSNEIPDITVTYGPGQTIQGSFNQSTFPYYAVATLYSGVVFINTP